MNAVLDVIYLWAAVMLTWLVLIVIILAAPLILLENAVCAIDTWLERRIMDEYGTSDLEIMKWIERDEEFDNTWR